jgi:Tol biopolymer transport system component
VPYLGGTPRLLGPVDDAESLLTGWSRIKPAIYFESRHNLSVLDLDSKRVSPITHLDPKRSSARDFKLSPTETRIVYSALQGRKFYVWGGSIDGGEAKLLTDSAGGMDISPVWVSDESRVAYLSKRDGIFQICLAGLTGNTTAQITFGNDDYTWLAGAPERGMIAAISRREQANIFSCQLQTHQEIRRTSGFDLQLSPELSSSDELIAFQSTKSLSRMDDTAVMQPLAANHQPIRIPNGFDAKWAPVGDTLAFLRSPDNQAELWKVSASGRDERRLTTGVLFGGMALRPFNRTDTNYNWSPDGSKIVYFSNKSGSWNLWEVSSDGARDTMLTQYTDPKLRLTSPFWSPDGNRIAYITELGGQRNICVFEREQSRRLFETEQALRLVGWSASGQEIYLAVGASQAPLPLQEVSLIQVSTNRADRKALAHAPLAYLHNVRLSPAGDALAFVSRQEGDDNIEVVSTSGGPIKRITSNSDPTVYYSSLTWSPKGKTVFYSKQASWSFVSLIEGFK